MLTPLSTPSEIYIKFGEQLRLYIIMNSINKTHKMITTLQTQERGESIYLLATTKGATSYEQPTGSP